MVTLDGRLSEDIDKRKTGAVWAFELATGNLQVRTVESLKTKMRISNTVMLPDLLYGATTQALTATKEDWMPLK